MLARLGSFAGHGSPHVSALQAQHEQMAAAQAAQRAGMAAAEAAQRAGMAEAAADQHRRNMAAAAAQHQQLMAAAQVGEGRETQSWSDSGSRNCLQSNR